MRSVAAECRNRCGDRCGSIPRRFDSVRSRFRKVAERTRHGQNEQELALQRKNALFAGHDARAQNWAMLASLIETCKFNSIEPHGSLLGFLTTITGKHKQTDIYRLLP